MARNTSATAEVDPPPFERIIATARELFLVQGFAATTVNQLIDASGTHKASFYRHFQSKQDVADEYITRERRAFLDGLRLLMERATDPADFVRRWSRILRKQVRSGAFHGCRISRLVQTLEPDQGLLRDHARAAVQSWIDALAEFLASEREAGRFTGDPRRTAEKFIRLFQGTAAMFRIHGDPAVFRLLEEDLLQEVT